MDWSIGVVKQHEMFVWPALKTVAAVEAFAEALADRYAAQPITASRVELALAYEAPAQVNYFQGGPEVGISPVVTINEQHIFAGIAREMAANTERFEGYSEAQAAALFERLFSRRVRVAAFVPPRETAQPRDPATREMRVIETPSRPDVVERILPRAMVAGKSSVFAETTPAVPPSARDTGWGTPVTFPETPKPVILPAPEIKRVAEQVMRELDRRVIASRERMGKR